MERKSTNGIVTSKPYKKTNDKKAISMRWIDRVSGKRFKKIRRSKNCYCGRSRMLKMFGKDRKGSKVTVQRKKRMVFV